MTDNTIVVSASEDLGGGMKLTGSMVIENDTARGTSWTRGDQSVSLAMPAFTFTLANTRSGGNQAAALVAPANLADDQWTSNVINREAVDVAQVNVPLSGGFTFIGRYLEGRNGNAKAWDNVAGSDTAKALAAGYAGADTPGTTTVTVGGSYATGALKVTGNYVSTSATDNLKALLRASNGGNDTRTTSTDLSAIYDAGIAKFGLGYDSARRGKPDSDAAATMLGVSVPFGAATVGVNYGKRDAAYFTQLAAQYDLSKRTNVNLSWGNDKQSDAAAINDQYRLSLNHSF